jgi:hypothetical protein
MISLEDRLTALTGEMQEIIEASAGVKPLETEEFGWENYRYESPKFRLAHIERYYVDGLVVAHVVVIPRESIGAPIFGFDVVGSAKTGRITGAFVDWSPMLWDGKWHSTEWNHDRKLPVWAECFSNQFVAIRPDEEETDKLFEFAIDTFMEYMMMLQECKGGNSKGQIDTIKIAQNKYCTHQASNPRTRAALNKKIGKERAEYFMTEILFPKI